MDTAPLFSVIIPVFNKWELTSDCLRSLKEHTRHPFELIVADNASGDATVSELEPLGRELFGENFQRLRFESNRNFGPACNAAARAARAPLLFFLNNDTLLTSGWAEPLLGALDENPCLGGVGPLLLYGNDTVQHLGVTFAPRGVSHLYSRFPSTHPAVKRRRRFQAITAAALMMPRDLFLEFDGFHEGFRNGFEDVDLCLRIHQTGRHFTCIPESLVYHLESQTVGRKDSEDDNARLLGERWGGKYRVDLHQFCSSDGFVPFVTDFLELGALLSDTDEQVLLRVVNGKSTDVWLQLINDHPLWVGGREHVASTLEKAGRFGEAISFRVQLSLVLRDEQSYRNLLRCAALAGNDTVRELTEDGFKRLMVYKTNRQAARVVAKRALDFATLYEDDLLMTLYSRKMNDLFPPEEGMETE